MGSVRIKKGCHVKCDGNINFCRGARHGWGREQRKGSEGCSVHLLCNVDLHNLQSRVHLGKESKERQHGHVKFVQEWA
jgi:hypothetical protein